MGGLRPPRFAIFDEATHLTGYPGANWSRDHETALRNIRAEFGQVRLAEAMGPSVRWPIKRRNTA